MRLGTLLVRPVRRRVVSASSRRRACDPEEFEALSHERAGQEIIANLSAAEPTGLAICNTVASAIKLTGELDDAAMIAGYDQIALGEVYDSLARRDDASFTPDKDETITECRARVLLETLDRQIEATGSPLVTLHLTTRHRPKDRKVLLEAASRLSDRRDVPFVFIATQLVEAGVDVSFTRVYRDFTPISSIVQAAGGCNRSAERDRETVTIWRLEKTDGADLPPSQLIYGIGKYNKLEPTARALCEVAPARSESEARTVRELSVAREGVQEYYRILDEDRDVGTEEYVDWVDSAQFAKLRDLSLINERAAFETIVCRSSEEQRRAEAFVQALDAEETATAHEHLETLEETQVSLPESEVRGEIPMDSQPVEFGERVLFVVDDYAGEGNFLPRTGLRG